MKLNRILIALTVCVAQVFVPNARAATETKGLLGQVLPDNLSDLMGWTVDVSAEMQGGGVLPGSPQSSAGNIYYFQASQDTVVSFIFAKTYYRSKRSPWISVTTDLSNPYRIMPDITLRRIKPPEQTARVDPSYSGSANAFVKASFKPTQTDAEAKERLRKELEEQAELARASKTADIFQFNLEVYQDVYRNEREAVRSSIAQFKADERFKDVSVAPRGRAELYQKMVQRNRGVNVTINPEDLYDIATDASLSPTIRIQSVKAMTPETVGTVLDRKNLDFLRQNLRSPSSKLYFSSMTQLLKVGEQSDKDDIVKSLESSDSQRITSVLNAIQAAEWKEGRNALIKLAGNERTPSAIQELAREAATKFTPVPVVNPDPTQPDRTLTWPNWLETPIRSTSRKMIVSPAAVGTEADLTLKPGGAGITEIVVNFRDLRTVEGATNYVLWAVDPDKRVVRLGQVIVTPNRRAGQIETETSLTKFGLFVTAEKTSMVTQPTGAVVAEIKQPM